MLRRVNQTTRALLVAREGTHERFTLRQDGVPDADVLTFRAVPGRCQQTAGVQEDKIGDAFVMALVRLATKFRLVQTKLLKLSDFNIQRMDDWHLRLYQLAID